MDREGCRASFGGDETVSLAGIPPDMCRFLGLHHAPLLPWEELRVAAAELFPDGGCIHLDETLPPDIAELDAVREGVQRKADGAAHGVDLEGPGAALVVEVVAEGALHTRQVAEVAAAGGEEGLHAAHGADADRARIGGGSGRDNGGLQGK